jgi:uncharacterized membrane protein HdeD (DUF308 family)
MFCKNCGKEVPENSKFCPSCGQSQEVIENEKPKEDTQGQPTMSTTEPAKKIILAHRGTMILVFGILGIVLNFICCVGVAQVFSILALVMGVGDLKKMKFGMMESEGKGITTAGMIMGIIGLALTIIAIVGFVLVLIFNGSWLTEYRNMSPFNGLNP